MLKILLIDDTADIRAHIRSILCPSISVAEKMKALIARTPILEDNDMAVSEATQGQEGVEMVQEAIQRGHPYHLAIIDMRMPPGIDGAETIRRIREFDKKICLVVCTAFSDHDPAELEALNGGPIKILQKPYTDDEIKAIACSVRSSIATVTR